METNSSKAFSQWRKRMDFTYSEAAEALGLSSAIVRFYARGIRRDKKGEDAREVEIRRCVLLACAALEKNVPPIN